MMRFGNHKSPVLLRALGDLLLNDDHREFRSSKRLASLAYMKADLEEYGEITAETREMVEHILMMQEKGLNKYGQLETLLNNKIKEGEIQFQSIRNNEVLWISNNSEVDKKFKDKYYKGESLTSNKLWYTLLSVIGVLILLVLGRKIYNNRFA